MMQPFYDGVAGSGELRAVRHLQRRQARRHPRPQDRRGPCRRPRPRALGRRRGRVVLARPDGASGASTTTSLRADNPSVIMLSTSLMGQTGPSAKLAGYGNIGASMSGYQDLVGWPDRSPIGPFGPYTDYVGPRFSLVALLAALDRRRRTGEGCYLDVAQSEIGVFLLSPQLADYFDRGTVALRRGNADERFAPHGVYRVPCARTARIASSRSPSAPTTQWRALAGELGRAELADDVRYATAAARLDARRRARRAGRRVDGQTSAPRRSRRSLQARGVPAHVCASSADWTRDPQLAHRGHLRALPHHGSAPRRSRDRATCCPRRPAGSTRPAPRLGQDNEYVLRTLLGYDQRALRRARRGGRPRLTEREERSGEYVAGRVAAAGRRCRARVRRRHDQLRRRRRRTRDHPPVHRAARDRLARCTTTPRPRARTATRTSSPRTRRP